MEGVRLVERAMAAELSEHLGIVHYADFRVMPTSSREALAAAVIAAVGSA